MEYTLRMSISPTVHEDSLAVRVFINASDGKGYSKTAQVWECSLAAVPAYGDTDPVQFAANLVTSAAVRLASASMHTIMQGQEKSMDELFEPKLF